MIRHPNTNPFSQRALNEALDMACRKAIGLQRTIVLSGDLLRHLYRPMTAAEESILRLAQAVHGLRDAEDYFSLRGHMRMASRRWRCRFRLRYDGRDWDVEPVPERIEAAKGGGPCT